MNRDSLKFIEDILDSIDVIKSHLSGIKTFSQFTSNLMLIDAVERRLSIVGEALGN
ncbi:MAG: HepT-like ribonuclease domain-containing protein [Ginsengibacter sp.]